ncbi:cyclase family protein [Myroides injenensis]|uniref:cyclase family protein n=1 Tax=Myroides injenensis TaxID=1183151 RepID=UPI000287B4DF|nr:cyclase family protein [Myroides injenensis]
MIATIYLNEKNYQIDFSKPIDISIPLANSDANPIAWYLEKPDISPVIMGDWIGKVSEGSSTNFNNINFNPHGHCTHTECLGHITNDFYCINDILRDFFFFAQLATILPEEQENGDYVITEEQIRAVWIENNQKAFIIRSLPNNIEKRNCKYSNTNPPYLSYLAANFLREKGVEHLLIDLPSVDKEKDGGKLLAHKAFWNVKDILNLNVDAMLSSTITEFIYVPNEVNDGFYFLNIQIASFVNDASPSKPILYQIF